MPAHQLRPVELALLSALCYAAGEYETRGIEPVRELLAEATIEELEVFLLIAQIFDDDEGPPQKLMQLNW